MFMNGLTEHHRPLHISTIVMKLLQSTCFAAAASDSAAAAKLSLHIQNVKQVGASLVVQDLSMETIQTCTAWVILLSEVWAWTKS